MKKLYYHCGGELINAEQYICSACKKVLPIGETLSEIPCAKGVAYLCVHNNFGFEISLWNLVPQLVIRDLKTFDLYTFKCKDEKIKEKIEKLMGDSIYEIGSALNLSGIYPINEELERFLEEKIDSGEIEIVKNYF